VDASPQTAAPNNKPAYPPFIRSGHLAAPGFSEHRIYWEEYGTLAGEPVIVMHGGPGAAAHLRIRPRLLSEPPFKRRHLRTDAARWGDKGVVDLAELIGYYSLVSMTLNIFEAPTPPGAKLLSETPQR
jgi:hypothetical protein